MNARAELDRREFASRCALLSAGAFAGISQHAGFASQITNDRNRPNITCGVSAGDVTHDSAIIWSRSDRPSRMVVDVATDDSFRHVQRRIGPEAIAASDFTAKLRLFGLPSGQSLFYRVRFQDLDNLNRYSAPVIGQLTTAPANYRDVTFAWSGDTAGQGYGIDAARGGMLTYETMRGRAPDFFVHSGDACYSDNPFPSEIQLDDGTTWKNIVTSETSKVAESLGEFRANLRYNLLDENVRRFNAQVPVFAQWDDHETTNNWYPGEQLLNDDRYTVKSASVLAARAKQAFFEYMPIRSLADARSRIYRSIPYGPLLELFFLDLRSYRGPNTKNRQPRATREAALLGRAQLRWLKQKLLATRCTWKVVCCDMPIGLVVRDGADAFENGANGDGPPLGREHEIASLLQFIKENGIKNVIWLTADVHYAASHYYDPEQAVFKNFDPFWEFVSGPLHAGTFGPSELDNTFGPQRKFCSIPDDMQPNRPPSEGLQFFGTVQIDGQSQALRVAHFNVAGDELWSVDLTPNRPGPT